MVSKAWKSMDILNKAVYSSIFFWWGILVCAFLYGIAFLSLSFRKSKYSNISKSKKSWRQLKSVLGIWKCLSLCLEACICTESNRTNTVICISVLCIKNYKDYSLFVVISVSKWSNGMFNSKPVNTSIGSVGMTQPS